MSRSEGSSVSYRLSCSLGLYLHMTMYQFPPPPARPLVPKGSLSVPLLGQARPIRFPCSTDLLQYT